MASSTPSAALPQLGAFFGNFLSSNKNKHINAIFYCILVQIKQAWNDLKMKAEKWRPNWCPARDYVQLG